MSWFKKNKSEPLTVAPPPAGRVEIELHKNANKAAANKAKAVNAHLSELLEENGFSIKIYLAAGGRPPKHARGK